VPVSCVSSQSFSSSRLRCLDHGSVELTWATATATLPIRYNRPRHCDRASYFPSSRRRLGSSAHPEAARNRHDCGLFCCAFPTDSHFNATDQSVPGAESPRNNYGPERVRAVVATFINALGRSRTFNLRIKSPLLCQLSYECKRTTCQAARTASEQTSHAGERTRSFLGRCTPNVRWRARRDSNPRPTA
jgi:hypothetical protein